MKYFHTALSVKNISVSQKFYESVFGFSLKTQGERPEIGVKFMVLIDNSGGIIELLQHDSPKLPKDDLMDFSNIGIKHIAFAVDSLESTIEIALKYGAKIIWPIKKGITVKRIAFVEDPDNIPIELVELNE
jgi:glyoxylase I family protein